MPTVTPPREREQIAHLATLLAVAAEFGLLAYVLASEAGPLKLTWYAWLLAPFVTLTLWLIIARREPNLPYPLVISVVGTSVGGPAFLAESLLLSRDPQGALFVIALPLYQLALQAACVAAYLLARAWHRYRARGADPD